MRKSFAYLTLIAIMWSSTSQAETLAEIYRQALQNDHKFKAARAAYEADREDEKIGLSGLLPQINGEASWQDREDNDTGIRRNDPVNDRIESTTSGYKISLTQPLFDMAAWHSFKSGKLSRKVADAQLKTAQQSLIIRTAEAYFDVLRAIDNFETAKAEENANSHQLEQSQKRFEVGLTAITEVHETQAAYDNSLARRLLAEGNVGITFEALEVITGQSYRGVSPLKQDFPISPPSPSNRKDWVDFATQNNFALAAASLGAEALRQVANQSKAAHYPKLVGNISYSDSNTDSNTNGTFITDVDTDGPSFGITLSVPLFAGGRISASRRQAANNYLESKENYLQTQRDIIQQARSLHLTVLTDVATVKARKQAIKSNQSAVEATKAGYDVGTRDLVDVLVAQRSLYTAQSNYSDALYTYVLNTLKLKEVAGILTEKDIAELDAWLDPSRSVNRLSM
ncbi:MAG: TolC family outer membrane protein [Agarilytica sp.]